jgi:hypothetical protein
MNRNDVPMKKKMSIQDRGNLETIYRNLVSLREELYETQTVLTPSEITIIDKLSNELIKIRNQDMIINNNSNVLSKEIASKWGYLQDEYLKY